ncbi:hepatitis A virus cellular receptor 2 homolog isoform X4 [Sebastes fasciatus]|uniref:hepatitis A virus cellular receptor 2 homolog isoform X4 n=1 Tax=Sebastes fasciatus TaxID=394691 RepID=UPI003D9EBB2C
MMKIVVLLVLLTVGVVVGDSVVGRVGGGVTLTCKYDIFHHGALGVCWGRGDIPPSGCRNQLISTDGHRVVDGTRASSRYQLLGRLEAGDVSLTILNVSETDAGRYGCRVDIYGWFNDKKHHFDLTVETAPQTTTSSPSSRETSPEQTDVSPPAGQLTSTELVQTSSSSSVTAEDSSVGVVLVCVLVGLVVLVTAGAGAIIAVSSRSPVGSSSGRRRRRRCSSRVEARWWRTSTR